MRGLTVIVAAADPVRFHAALSLAAAQAAIGGGARIFLQADAVALLRPPICSPSDDRNAAAGTPTLGALVEEALAMGVSLTVCQSGLALAGMSAADLPPGTEAGGLVGVLREASEDRLLLA